jgi:hypothetical protein
MHSIRFSCVNVSSIFSHEIIIHHHIINANNGKIIKAVCCIIVTNCVILGLHLLLCLYIVALFNKFSFDFAIAII